MVARAAVTLMSVLFVLPAHAEPAWQFNLTKGVTDMTHRLWNLHMLIFWICVVIGIGVFGTMLYSVIRHRKSRGVEAANFHESTVVEITWTVIPFLILVAVAIPAAGTLLKIEDSSNADLTIRVTGYQWLWEYKYVESGVHFYSRLSDSSMRARALESVSPYEVDHYLRSVTNRLVVPVDKKVRLLLTSGDVIHSWWVPKLGGKKDAIPGYINDMWFKANKTGVYRGQCTELCGRGHAYMPIVVEVVTQEQFKQWIAMKTSNGKASQQGKVDAAAQSTSNPPGAGGSADQSEGGADNDRKQDQATAGRAGPATQVAAKQQARDAGEQDSGQLSKNELMALGEQVYGNYCAVCHQADGSGMPVAGFPSLTGSDVVTGPVAPHITQILEGSGAMPPFAGRLSNKEIAAVVTYERNALGNSTGDVVQPSDVAAQR